MTKGQVIEVAKSIARDKASITLEERHYLAKENELIIQTTYNLFFVTNKAVFVTSENLIEIYKGIVGKNLEQIITDYTNNAKPIYDENLVTSWQEQDKQNTMFVSIRDRQKESLEVWRKIYKEFIQIPVGKGKSITDDEN